MKIFSKLANPVLLAAEGFVVGVLVFVLANPQMLDSHPRLSPDSAALVRSLTR